MATHTYRTFVCPYGHQGKEKTSENDQPYSENWEYVHIFNMKAAGKDEKGYPIYTCAVCGEDMQEKK